MKNFSSNYVVFGLLFINIFCTNQSFADDILKQADLVGKWQCKSIDADLDLTHHSVWEIRSNGTFQDKSVTDEYQGDDYHKIIKMNSIGRWQIKDNKLYHYDMVVQSYKIEMPNYEKTNFSQIVMPKKNALSILAQIERTEIEASLSQNMTARIRFIDKNTFISAYDEFDDDFPTDIENNHCKRITHS